mmetsp:Transcript_6850/g.23298  ORF Transcript_6850/g.23298 Transcript_6850/m.23298 type:complete len:87 (+) Transcript_6850:265-525(+)
MQPGRRLSARKDPFCTPDKRLKPISGLKMNNSSFSLCLPTIVRGWRNSCDHHGTNVEKLHMLRICTELGVCFDTAAILKDQMVWME